MASDEPKEPNETAAKTPPRRKGHRVWRGLAVGWFVVTCVLLLGLGAGLFLASGRAIDAPEWLRERVATQAGKAVSGANLDFGGMQLVVVSGWEPRLRLTDVDVVLPDGQPVLNVSQMDLGVSVPDLIEGRLRPRTLSLAGIFATLRRDAEGQYSLSGGLTLSGAAKEAQSLPELLKALDALLLRPEFEKLYRAEIQALTLRYEDVVSGRAWTLDGGRIDAGRDGRMLTATADLAVLSGSAGIATLRASYTSSIGEAVADFGATVDNVDAADIAAQGPALAWLSALRAPISGALRSGLDASGQLRPLVATLSIGAGVVQPTDATRPVPFNEAQAYFSYDPEERVLRFDELSVDSKWGSGQAFGQAWLEPQADGGDQFVAQFDLAELVLNPFELYETPRLMSQASVDLRMSLDPFRLELGQATLDLAGDSLHVAGDLRGDPEGWRVALDARIAKTNAQRVLDWWPAAFAARTRGWLSANVLQAEMRQVDIALRGMPGGPVRSFISFDYDDTAVRFHPDLPPVEASKGQVSLDANRLVVAIDAGRIVAPDGSALDVGESAFIIPDILEKAEPRGEVQLRSTGTLGGTLAFIDLPPLSVLSRAGRGPDLASGGASIEGSLSVPLRKGTGALRYDLSGTLTDVRSTSLVPDRSLRANALVMAATQDEVIIGGPGTLDGLPFEAAWRQEIKPDTPGTVSGTITLSQRMLDTFGIGLPSDTIRGTAQGELTVTLAKGKAPSFNLTSDLRGARLRFAPLGWTKPAGIRGELAIAGTLGPRPDVSSLVLDASGLKANGRVSLRSDGTLNEARFSRVSVGGWLDAPVILSGRGKGRAPAVQVTSGSIDLRRASFGAGGGNGADSGPLTLSLKRLQVSDSIALTNFAGQFAGGRGLDGRFTARVAGGPAVDGRMVPQNGRSAMRITSDDAGGVMAAAGLLRQAVGGALTLTLLPVLGQEGVFDGTLEVTETRVKNAPAIADLLSAVSIVGLLEQLSGNGIVFAQVDANFRLSPDRVVLRNASAVGPSMGITMDGSYRMEGKNLDMQGVISPVYFLNAIGQLVSRRGEGLIGFNYRLRGTADTPKVQVNPFSALTPGLFREIFRAPPPDLPAQDAPRALLPAELQADDTPAEPAAKPARRTPVGEDR